MFRAQLEFQQKLLKQHRQRQNDKKNKIKEFDTKQKNLQKEITRRVLAANKLQAAKLQTVVIHTGASEECAVSDQRMLDYLNHLHNIIEKAASLQSINDCVQDEHYDALRKQENIERKFSANPGLQAISDQLCTRCKGGCCVAGNEHAYLSIFSMRQQLDQNPHWSAQYLFQQYVQRISTHSMHGSCINHTSQGCALARELRSNICNAFYCDDLKALHKSNEHSTPEKLLVIQREKSYSAWANPDEANDVTDVVLIERDTVTAVDGVTGEIKYLID